MIVIAHRANGFGFPQNTIEAVCACVDAGFVPEIDLRAPGGAAVLAHGRPRGGEPRYEALVERLDTPLRRGRPITLLLHLKDRAAHTAVRKFDWLQPVTFGRFGHGAMYLEADRENDIIGSPGGVVCTDDDEWLDAACVQRFHRRGATVLAAGGNIFRPNPTRWAELYAAGVDGIVTDSPRALLALLEEKQ